MHMQAYLLIAVQEGKELDLQQKLLDFDKVLEVNIVFGEWDLIAKVEEASPESLATFVMDKIRSEKYVNLTSTIIVAK